MAPASAQPQWNPELVESHEDRLQNVERTGSETSAKVDTALTKIEALKEATSAQTVTITDKMKENQELVLDKMGEGFNRVFEHLDPLAAKVAVLADDHAKNSKRIDSLEGSEARRARVTKFLRGTAWVLVLAAVSATAGKFGEALWVFFTK